MERFKLNLDAELIYLEDFAGKVTLADKLVSAATALAGPHRLARTASRTDRGQGR